MTKYDKLRDYLRAQRFSEITLSFAEIENVLGFALPASADRPQWWANEKNPNTTKPQRIACRDAGFDAFLISGSRKIRFVRSLSARLRR
jgi:hypothetical protein